MLHRKQPVRIKNMTEKVEALRGGDFEEAQLKRFIKGDGYTVSPASELSRKNSRNNPVSRMGYR